MYHDRHTFDFRLSHVTKNKPVAVPVLVERKSMFIILPLIIAGGDIIPFLASKRLFKGRQVVGEAPVTPFLCGGIPLTFGGIH